MIAYMYHMYYLLCVRNNTIIMARNGIIKALLQSHSMEISTDKRRRLDVYLVMSVF